MSLDTGTPDNSPRESRTKRREASTRYTLEQYYENSRVCSLVDLQKSFITCRDGRHGCFGCVWFSYLFTFQCVQHSVCPGYGAHRPSPSAAGARLWIIRGRDRPRYIRVIFSDCRHRRERRLDRGVVTMQPDWPISRIRCEFLRLQAWLTAGRDSAGTTFVDMKLSERIRAPLTLDP